jgi:hypothetical protein
LKKNTGIPYENVTQEIFKEILNQDSVETVIVEHDITLQGKTTTHQIDVYWKFKVGGILYETIIQAKDWKSKVKQEQLLAFKSILEDLPGQPKGIFVTRTGYQKGAQAFASAHGILLYELREPNDRDWEGKIKDIIINGTSYVPSAKDIKLNYDIDWAKLEKVKLNIPSDKRVDIDIADQANNLHLINDRSEKVCTVHDIVKKLYPGSSFIELSPTLVTHIFDTATFILTNNQEFPRIKLISIEATISVTANKSEIKIEGDNIIGFILKDALNGTEKMFDPNIKLLGKEKE